MLKKEIEYVIKHDGKPRKLTNFPRNNMIMDSMIGGMLLT